MLTRKNNKNNAILGDEEDDLNYKRRYRNNNSAPLQESDMIFDDGALHINNRTAMDETYRTVKMDIQTKLKKIIPNLKIREPKLDITFKSSSVIKSYLEPNHTKAQLLKFKKVSDKEDAHFMEQVQQSMSMMRVRSIRNSNSITNSINKTSFKSSISEIDDARMEKLKKTFNFMKPKDVVIPMPKYNPYSKANYGFRMLPKKNKNQDDDEFLKQIYLMC
ncbi:hypothetical protein K502DRAFT_83938 [Neoconidiobolus thromboides FSU 785]|nr:hypothetical protein K502DRAFT_83938 [Neoconidiobolus thromboides FSU 785]